MTLPRINDTHLSLDQRRWVAVAIAGAACIALAITSITLGGSAADGMGFVFFVLSLPWTLSVAVLTMVIGVYSPVAVVVALAIPTLVLWRVGSLMLIKRCVTEQAS